MLYFVDTEFSERGPQYPIELISIGIVAEDGRTFYAISSEFNAESCNDFVKQHVLPCIALQGLETVTWRLTTYDAPVSLAVIRQGMLDFVGDDLDLKFWGYMCDYDWVVIAQLFGTMMDLPKTWPRFCHDLKQRMEDKHYLRKDLPGQAESGRHNALWDALWVREAFYVIEQRTAVK